jgi:hypothetical protein
VEQQDRDQRLGFTSNSMLVGTSSINVNVQNVAPTPSPSPTPAPKPTPTPTPSPTPKPSPTPSSTPTPSPSPTAAYYFSPTGSDSSAQCTLSAPCLSLTTAQSLISSAKPGVAILFERGGIWTGGLTLSGLNGLASAPITIGNYGSGALPIFDGVSNTANGFYASSGSYVTVDGFEVRNFTRTGVQLHSNGGVAMPGWTVQNMNIHNTGPGAYAGGSGGFDDNTYSNQLEFLEYGYHADGVKFLNNRVGSCGGHNCIQVHGDTGSPLVKGNTCYGWQHNCIDLKAVKGAVVADNVVQGPGPGGAAYYLENTAIPAADVTWQGNVAYNVNNGIQCEGGGGTLSQTVTCRAYNNTLYLGVGSAIVTGSDCTQPINWDVRNNILDTGNATYTPSSCSNRSMTWDYNDDCGTAGTCTSGYKGVHDLNGLNPNYVDASAADFRLTASSPCSGAGLTGLTPGNNDMGAY